MRTVVGRLAFVVVLSVLAGAVLAGLALPVLGGAGLLARAGAQTFLDLPSRLTPSPLPQRTRILDKDGGTLATLFTENRVRVRLGDVPMTAQTALIAIEDSRFYAHNGIDLKGTARALAHNSSGGGGQQGGSTLTQQYVKNTLLEDAHGQVAQQDAARERSVRRKLQEARYALQLEKTMTKAQILEGYFNIAYYGNGLYGIGTAANHYFNRPVQKLTLGQGALLAGLVQNPAGYDPELHPQAARARRDVVLTRMLGLGKISPAAYAAAVHQPLGLHISSVSSGCEAKGVSAPFFCDYIRRYLENGPVQGVLGDSLAKRQEQLFSGGLTIRTTLDPKVQRAAQTAVDQQVPAGDPSRTAGVVDSVVPGTGAVAAMAVDRRYGAKPGETKVNYALGGSLGFQGGSTFKAFVLARALQLGISPKLTLFAPNNYCAKAFVYKRPDGQCPGNAGDSEAGNYSMVQATWRSVNTYFIQLEERTGLETPPALAEALGVRQVNGTFAGRPLDRYASFVLGASNTVSPLAMSAAYATFAAHGLYCPPRPVVSITDGRGAALKLPAQPCKQALESGIADTVTSILRGVIDGPDPFRTGVDASIGRPTAGKTGTTDESRAAWFIGYTPQLSTAVWVGQSTPAPQVNITINHKHYPQVFGGTLPAAVWHQMMAAAMDGVPPTDFPGPDLSSLQGASTTVPDVSGLPLGVAEQQLREAGFGVVRGFAIHAAPIPAGSVARTTPAAGTQAPAGIDVVLIPSDGTNAPPPPPPPPPPAHVKPKPSPKPVVTHSPKPKPVRSPPPHKKKKPHQG